MTSPAKSFTRANQPNFSPLEQALLSTLAWFDLSRYPVTTFEAWYYLYSQDKLPPITPAEVGLALRQLEDKGQVESQQGFWQLSGRENYLPSRLGRARLAIVKRQRAWAGARLIACLPLVRFVGLVNTVAWEASAPGSDIDLFIVLPPRRLFLGRLLVALVVQLRGWRRYSDHITNRLCLSFFVTADQLDLSPFALSNDPYLKFWVASVVPLSNRYGVYEQFLAANSWVGKNLPNWKGCTVDALARTQHQSVAEKSHGFLWWLGNGLESLARTIQLPRLRRYLGKRLNDGSTAVVVSSRVLKMHTNDRRIELAQAFFDRLRQLGIDVL